MIENTNKIFHRKYIIFYRDSNEFDNWIIAGEFDSIETVKFYLGEYNPLSYLLVELVPFDNQIIDNS